MLSLRSGLLLLGQAKSKSPSVANLYRFHIGNRGKPERSDRITISECGRMTTVIGIYNKDCFGSLSPASQ
ncbi:hypothetical protein ASE74_23275 [Pedobacter sp. Leaf216]|nr:hypothetical protein ASE74_23275 [Pedobacter sp. Leaf216]